MFKKKKKILKIYQQEDNRKWNIFVPFFLFFNWKNAKVQQATLDKYYKDVHFCTGFIFATIPHTNILLANT